MYCSKYIYMAVHSHISCPPSITEKWIENSSYKSSLNRKFRQNEVILHFLLLRTTSSCIKIVKKRSFLLSLIFSLGPLTWAAKLEGKKLPNASIFSVVFAKIFGSRDSKTWANTRWVGLRRQQHNIMLGNYYMYKSKPVFI